jgi:hypothetical protein
MMIWDKYGPILILKGGPGSEISISEVTRKLTQRTCVVCVFDVTHDDDQSTINFGGNKTHETSEFPWPGFQVTGLQVDK